MKKLFLPALAFCLAGCMNCADGQPRQERLLSVSADAQVRVKPNRAALTLGVEQHTSDLRAGQEYMRRVIARITEYCRQHGVEQKDLQTHEVFISPVYAPNYYDAAGQKEVQTQYNLRQTLTVTLTDPTQYETFLYALLNLGANRVENVSFYSSEMRQYRDEARRLAVRYAAEKADLLAQSAGVKRGELVSLQETAQPMFYAAAANVSQNMLNTSVSAEEGPAVGMITVKSGVAAVYRIQ